MESMTSGPRLKIGLIGCGAIAQVQHLPHLREMPEEFEIAGLCDLSRTLVDRLGEEYGVAPERRVTDHPGMLATDPRAAMVRPTGPDGPPSIAAPRRGKARFVDE